MGQFVASSVPSTKVSLGLRLLLAMSLVGAGCAGDDALPSNDAGARDVAESDAAMDAVESDTVRVADSAMSDIGTRDAEQDTSLPDVAAMDAGTPDAGSLSVERSYTVWVWNVAGNLLHSGATDTGLIEAAASSIVNRDADFVGFNELCRSQYVALQEALRARGWPLSENFSRFAEALPVTPGVCQGTAYGNAIFSREPLGDATRLELPSDGRTESRTALCAPLENLPHMRWCTTHVTTSNEVGEDGLAANVRQLQALQAHLLDYHTNGDTVLIGGDFNAQPHYGRLDRFYAPSVNTDVNGNNRGVHRELDDTDPICLGHGEGTVADSTGGPCGTGVRIDHIFAREDEIVGTYSSDALSISTACDGPCSDHRIVIGEVNVRIRR